MAEKLKVELQDDKGNIYYLHTGASVVFCEDGSTVQSKLNGMVKKSDIIQNATTAATDKVVSGAVAKNLQDQISEQNTKIIVENKTVQISAGADYSYVPYKSGYVLASAKGTTFSGVYVTGIADTGINYAIFFNTAGQQAASLTLNLLWIKIS